MMCYYLNVQFQGQRVKVLHLEYRFVWCRNLNTSESRSQIPDNFEMWCWRRIEKISWTDRLSNEEILNRFQEYTTCNKYKKVELDWSHFA